MAMNPPASGRAFSLLGKTLLGLLAVGCIADFACPQGKDPTPTYDVSRKNLTLIEPGTVIDAQPPEGWSHLIIKNRSRVGAGDVDRMNATTNYLASFLFSAIVANVQAERQGDQPRYRLTGVGFGIGTRINGKDTIISSATQEKLGAGLGLLARTALGRAEKRLPDMQVVVRSETMAIVDALTRLARQEKHQSVVFRHAMLVDPRTGQLDTLLWVIDQDARDGYRGVASGFEWLPPNKLEDIVLHIDGNEFALGLPTENAIAMNAVPKGQKQLPIPDDLKVAAGRAYLTKEMAQEMETRLRALLKEAPK